MVMSAFGLSGAVCRPILRANSAQADFPARARNLLRSIANALSGAGPRSEIKAITKNHLGNQVVGCSRESYAKSKIDLPLRCDIQINRRENLVLLLRNGIEACHRPDRAVIFQTSRNFRCEIVAEFEIGRKN